MEIFRKFRKKNIFHENYNRDFNEKTTFVFDRKYFLSKFFVKSYSRNFYHVRKILLLSLKRKEVARIGAKINSENTSY